MENILKLLDWLLYIYYLFCFWKKILDIGPLIDLSNKVNAIKPIYASKLGFKNCYTNIGAEKI